MLRGAVEGLARGSLVGARGADPPDVKNTFKNFIEK